VNDGAATRATTKVVMSPSHGVSLHEGFWSWMRVAALSYDGPVGRFPHAR